MPKPETPTEGEPKPHYFELVMNSYSNGVMNQEIVILREYAPTPGQLVLKQMDFTRDAAPEIIDTVIKWCDKASKPYQEQGLAEVLAGD
jgi:hypothetical protein